MRRTDYLDDPAAPKANRLVPSASAIVTDRRGRILLHRRSDNGLWALPGGTMEIGERIAETVRREVREETGLEVEPRRVVGVYSDPLHVIAYPDGEVRQEFSICFACRVIGGELSLSEESSQLTFFTRRQIDVLDLHPSIRQRIADYRARSGHAAIR